ncbi:hypothetical protein [Aquimarina pacifica]|uniref:hypothetical protein n=1 Tax=Aquimarina pacifica TaxID=1296415 RepID=UPI000472170E|nr:hypothetical protein [Aquimarina pacifica]
MKKIKFQQFLKTNRLKRSELPKPLLDKMVLFWKLHNILQNIQDSDRQELLDQLEQLDYEILGAIEEEYEDELQNNDRLESLIKSPAIPKVIKDQAKETKKSDEQILDQLVAIKRTRNISWDELQKLGFTQDLGRRTAIGKYTVLQNSFWYYTYNIIPQNDH